MKTKFGYFILSIVIVCVWAVPYFLIEHTFETVKPGEKYVIVHHENDPFKKESRDTFYVKDVKKGWVKWVSKYRSSDGKVNEIEFTGKKSFFLRVTDYKIE